MVYIEVAAVIVFVAVVAAFAVWFVRRKRGESSRYKMLPRFGGDDEEAELENEEHEHDDDGDSGGTLHRLPTYDNQLTEEHDPGLAAEMHSRAQERDLALSSPTPVSPSPLQIQGEDEPENSASMFAI